MPEPLRPTMASRSPSRPRATTGPSRNPAAVAVAAAGRSTTASASRATTSPLRPASAMVQPQVPALPRLVDRLEPGQRLVGDLGLGRHVLGAGDVAVADELVGLARALGPAHALVAHWRWVRARSVRASRLRRRPVVLLGVLAGQGPLVEVGVPAALVAGERVLVVVDLGHRGDRRSRKARSCDTTMTGREAEDEPLEPVEAVEVEVVGRLVEQEHVEPGEQQRGELGAGGLAARQAGTGRSSSARARPRSSADRGGPGVEVGAAERHPAVERERV